MYIVLLALPALAAAASSGRSDGPARYQLGDVEGLRLPEPCRNGNPVSCRQVSTDCVAMLSADEFEFNNITYKNTERNVEEKGAMTSFVNAAHGGLAVFAIGNRSNPDCVVEGRIRLGKTSHFNLDYYAPEGASVLSEWKGPPKGEALGIANQRRRETALGRRRGSRNGGGADPGCADYLDYSLCGFLANSGQCNLMNILAAAGIWVPCSATCGSCCGDSSWWWCEFIVYTY